MVLVTQLTRGSNNHSRVDARIRDRVEGVGRDGPWLLRSSVARCHRQFWLSQIERQLCTFFVWRRPERGERGESAHAAGLRDQKLELLLPRFILRNY